MRRFTLVTACVTLLTWTCCCMTFWTGGPGLCLFRLQVFWMLRQFSIFVSSFPQYTTTETVSVAETSRLQTMTLKTTLDQIFSWNTCKHLMIDVIFSRGWVRNNSLIHLESEMRRFASEKLKIYDLQWFKTEKIIISSHLRSWECKCFTCFIDKLLVRHNGVNLW